MCKINKRIFAASKQVSGLNLKVCRGERERLWESFRAVIRATLDVRQEGS